MAEILRSVGLDVGTTTTQLILSELTVENQASAFSVPQMVIVERKILYKSPIHFTPLLTGDLVDGDGIRHIVSQEYEKAGIRRDAVDTGAIIITGETSRKENARAVLDSLSDFAGEFVVATAGPDLESVLAAKGAGAVELSENATVLHMDIGGGTSNLALLQDGKILATGCLNVGGRLLKFQDGKVSYVSSVLEGLTDIQVGDSVNERKIDALAQTLAQTLEMAAGLRQPTELLDKLWTKELQQRNPLFGSTLENLTFSFSGGVADCIETNHPPFAFGDMGPALGKAIRQSRLCQGNYALGQETIRATVIGAGCHTAQLSGSTVYHRNVAFPLKNLPVVSLGQPDGVIAIEGIPSATYAQISELADTIAQRIPDGPVYLAMEQDMAKALGQALALRLGSNRPVLCLDRIRLSEGDYLDVAAPVGPALPVVIKTLVFSR